MTFLVLIYYNFSDMWARPFRGLGIDIQLQSKRNQPVPSS